jgi:hypothetical protein
MAASRAGRRNLRDRHGVNVDEYRQAAVISSWSDLGAFSGPGLTGILARPLRELMEMPTDDPECRR